MKKLTECRLKAPSNWGELSDNQKLFVAYLQLKYERGEDMLTRAFMFCTGLTIVEGQDPVQEKHEYFRWFRLGKSSPFLIEDTLFASAVSKMSFLLQPPEGYIPIKRIKRGRAIHPKFYGVIFEVYLMAENFYMAYTKTNKIEFLDCLCAVLYKRPFQKWNSSLLKKRAKYFSKVDPHLKITVFTWYASFRNMVVRECPNLNSPAQSGSEPKIKEIVNGMMRMLNKGDIKGNPAILKADTWDALYELEAQAKEYKQLKSKYGI